MVAGARRCVVQNLRLRLLGDLQVEGCNSARLARRQLRTLLKVLALHHDRPVGLDKLVDCLWGDDPPARPADQVSVLVSRLRGCSVPIGFGAATPATPW
jgi:DNA-binding SARP family transcriptional activator